MKDIIIELKDIVVEYPLKTGSVKAVNNANLKIERGKITALVGESGSGKTTLASTILRCLTSPGKLCSGSILFHSKDKSTIQVDTLNEKELEKFRWEKVSMVFQAAQSSLNPVMTIWESFYETYHCHFPEVSKEVIRDKSIELLKSVKLDAERILLSYPHELSGGMKQRVIIAFSMLLDPELIILDEPTTALDVITQDYIFRILKEINKTKNVTMLLMTHDMNVVGKFSDMVGIMYAGSIMEFGPTKEVFKNQLHPYTEGLIHATPSLWGDISSLKSIPGSPPDLKNLPNGCSFAERCSYCSDCCLKAFPPRIDLHDDSFLHCYHWNDKENSK